MTPLLVLLALLSVATLASRRGAASALVQSAATPLLLGLGVLLSPRVLGFFTPSTVAGLAPAVHVGATTLALLVGVRAASIAREDARPASVGAFGVALSVTLALPVLWATGLALDALFPSALQLGDTRSARELAAAALLIGACLAGLPADAPDTPRPVSAWAHATELCAAAMAIGALAVLSGADFAVTVGFVLALGSVGAVVFLLVPASDRVARAVALLGVVTLLAGLTRLVDVPGALPGFLMGVLLGRTQLGRELAPLLAQGERPLRIVVTVVVAAATPIHARDLVVGAALALGQLGVQALSASLLHIDRSRLSLVLSSSATPVALVASFAACARTTDVTGVLGAILIALALTDLVALIIGLAQRRSENTEPRGLRRPPRTPRATPAAQPPPTPATGERP